MTMACTNPNCRHRSKRKLRPLVISLIPQNDDSCPSSTNPKSGDSGSSSGNRSRHEKITRMFTSHPALAAHFEPPAFSPGVSSRDLNNRLKLLDHANNAGLIPELEWKEICRAVEEQISDEGNDDTLDGANNGNQAGEIRSKLSAMKLKACERADGKHKVIDPFRYLATTTEIQPNNDDANNTNENKTRKKKHWLEYQTTTLVPMSPQRCGSAEDISLPYSMELWRKAKTLNRDRSVLACTLAHLMAMKALVGESDNKALDGNNRDGGFDFILEDNVRAFVGFEDAAEYLTDASSENDNKQGVEHWTGWSCECSNRIWDIIEASNAAPSKCHMRYFGWLGSLPNLTWIYKHHLPRTGFDNASLQNDAMDIFPYPTSDDFELDSIIATTESKNQADEKMGGQATSNKKSQTPHFSTPGGTAVWGTFAYPISPPAYSTLINKLQNDVGSLMWKGKRMRAYHAKPIDKVLPRHVKFEFGEKSVHVPTKVAFVRGPMLGSLLHPHWEEGFCNSTERQYHLSCRGEDVDNDNGSDVWDHVWLTKEERQIVNHRKKTGKWAQKGDLEKVGNEEPNSHLNGTFTNNHTSRGHRSRATISKVIPLIAYVAMMSFLSLSIEHIFPRYVLVNAFAHHASIHNKNKRSTAVRVTGQDDNEGRNRAKLGKVPIISRTIPIEIKAPSNLPGKDIEETERLDVTVWEMDKPSDLIQEWWSIDDSERSARVGDPFGVVMWPGSITASQEMMKQHYSSPFKSPITNATVLVLGAGTGVEAQTAALLGAKTVIATDINPLTLKLLDYGANHDERIGGTVEGKYYDLFSSDPLPACDIIIAADVLYNPDLAKQVGLRLHEAIIRSFEDGNPPTKVIVTDSQQFHGTNFLEEVVQLQELNALFKENDWEQLEWVTQKLENVCGSGVVIDEDQVYDVEVRLIRWGWQW